MRCLRKPLSFSAAFLLCFCAGPATTLSPTQARSLKSLQQAVQNAQSNADNAWMLVSAALVLLMTGPGLALFYGGLVRRKNILGTMMQSFAMMGLVTILVGHRGLFARLRPRQLLSSAASSTFFCAASDLRPIPTTRPRFPNRPTWSTSSCSPSSRPALITGAFAERMKFSAMAVFLSLWSLLVYSPMAHMVWGVGGLLNASGGHIPSLDFAGGTVVHITSGVSALSRPSTLGKRLGYPHTNMPPHSMVLSFIGACLLWVGWFGFNAGSALGSGPLATSAFINTHFAAAAAALGWTIAEWIHNGKPTALGAISGAVAGLVAITPASGFVQPFSALLIGADRRRFLFVHGLRSEKPFRLRRLARCLWRARSRWNSRRIAHRPVRDQCDQCGLRQRRADRRYGWPLGPGAEPGRGRRQLPGSSPIVGTLVLLFVVDKVDRTCASRPRTKRTGLDLSQHGEEGYDLNS